MVRHQTRRGGSMNTSPTFFEIPYDEVDHYEDSIGGYTETSDFEFMSDEELQALQDSIWGDTQ